VIRVRTRANCARQIAGIDPHHTAPGPGAPCTRESSGIRGTSKHSPTSRQGYATRALTGTCASTGRAIHPTPQLARCGGARESTCARRGVRQISDAACSTGATAGVARSPAHCSGEHVRGSGRCGGCAARRRRAFRLAKHRRCFSCRRTRAVVRKRSVDECDEDKKSMPMLSVFPMRCASHRARSTPLRVRARLRKVAQFCANRAEIGPSAVSAEKFFSSPSGAGGGPRRRRAEHARIVRAQDAPQTVHKCAIEQICATLLRGVFQKVAADRMITRIFRVSKHADRTRGMPWRYQRIDV